MNSDSAGRLSPEVWADVEAQLAAQTAQYNPKDLLDHGMDLVSALDQDGANLTTEPHH